MRTMSRSDVAALNQAKSTFEASVSHEFYPLLHIVMGTHDFNKDTLLVSFPKSVSHSHNACGITSLGIFSHVIYHTKLSQARKDVSLR